MLGHPLAPITLDAVERKRLEGFATRPKTAQALGLRARIVLKAADGLSNSAISQELRVSKQTVC